ncbi:cytidine deaminase [Thalassospira profundimaris]|uniref:cytidine deaminase n=1 Tax=Thalassospira profundimaris TaxID=502049 RepID=UPI000DEDE9B8|nr:cytidine deaminase [Thalassospira profundimaris]
MTDSNSASLAVGSVKSVAPSDLVAAAQAARKNAYAPYSNFLVGAALRTENGAIIAGCNVENAAYPEGVCAEGGAISAMVLAGERKITEIVVVGSGDVACTPCGGCRQKIREFSGPDAKIYIISEEGKTLLTLSREELIPHSFGPENLS